MVSFYFEYFDRDSPFQNSKLLRREDVTRSFWVKIFLKIQLQCQHLNFLMMVHRCLRWWVFKSASLNKDTKNHYNQNENTLVINNTSIHLKNKFLFKSPLELALPPLVRVKKSIIPARIKRIVATISFIESKELPTHPQYVIS